MERTEVPSWARPTNPPATPRQMAFLRVLLEERDLSSLEEGQIAFLESDFAVDKAQASRIISKLVTLPKKPKNEQERAEKSARLEDIAWQQALYDLPAGRYAIENNEGELRFYQKWERKDKSRFALYVQHSDDMSPLPRKAQVVIAQKIMDAGYRECAIRYGMEIGHCSNCGRTLTNRISRELGIGPICGGRMFGDDWKDEVRTKREEIMLRGEDPDEELQ